MRPRALPRRQQGRARQCQRAQRRERRGSACWHRRLGLWSGARCIEQACLSTRQLRGRLCQRRSRRSGRQATSQRDAATSGIPQILHLAPGAEPGPPHAHATDPAIGMASRVRGGGCAAEERRGAAPRELRLRDAAMTGDQLRQRTAKRRPGGATCPRNPPARLAPGPPADLRTLRPVAMLALEEPGPQGRATGVVPTGFDGVPAGRVAD